MWSLDWSNLRDFKGIPICVVFNFQVTSPYFWRHIFLHRVKLVTSSSDCDFLGNPNPPDLVPVHSAMIDRTPEKMVCIGNGELVLTELNASFFQNSSPAHSSLLLTWGTWDNSLTVRSTMQETTYIRLHSHPLNRVGCKPHSQTPKPSPPDFSLKRSS